MNISMHRDPVSLKMGSHFYSPTSAGMWYPSITTSSAIFLGNTGKTGYNLCVYGMCSRFSGTCNWLSLHSASNMWPYTQNIYLRVSLAQLLTNCIFWISSNVGGWSGLRTDVTSLYSLSCRSGFLATSCSKKVEVFDVYRIQKNED